MRYIVLYCTDAKRHINKQATTEKNSATNCCQYLLPIYSELVMVDVVQRNCWLETGVRIDPPSPYKPTDTTCMHGADESRELRKVAIFKPLAKVRLYSTTVKNQSPSMPCTSQTPWRPDMNFNLSFPPLLPPPLHPVRRST